MNASSKCWRYYANEKWFGRPSALASFCLAIKLFNFARQPAESADLTAKPAEGCSRQLRVSRPASSKGVVKQRQTPHEDSKFEAPGTTECETFPM